MYQALAATSETLRFQLQEAMTSDIGPTGLAGFFAGANTAVSLQTPQEMAGTTQGLSVWLYRISRDEMRLNAPPTLRTLPSGRVQVIPPPLPLRLHYLLTPLVDNNADTEQRILGRAIQLFHTHPILSGAMLRAEFTGTAVEIHVHLEALGLEEMTRVWEALEGSYQLAVSYEVTLANIDSLLFPETDALVEAVRTEFAPIVARAP